MVQTGVVCAALVAAVVAGGMPASGAAARGNNPPSGDDLVRPSLVLDTTAVEPGKPFRAGVLLAIEPGWHTYWANPGDSGEPPRIEWRLPEGFSAGSPVFPTPIRFDVPGGIVNYGYKDATVLLVTITPPAAVDASTVELSADVSWLVCTDEVCLPGSGKVQAVVPVGKVSESQSATFARWMEQLPMPAGADGNVASITPIAPSGDGRFGFSVRWADARCKPGDWFPNPPEGVEIRDVTVTTTAATTTVTGTARALGGRPFAAGATLDSVLAYTDADGNYRGLQVPVALSPTTTADEKPSEGSANSRK